MRFARWVFGLSGALGVLFMVPFYFTEAQTSRDYPPAINHPEYYYGFAGVTLACQILFLIIATDPVRLRPVMPAALVEKGSFVLAIVVLYLQERVYPIWLLFASIDATWFVLFAAAYVRLRSR